MLSKFCEALLKQFSGDNRRARFRRHTEARRSNNSMPRVANTSTMEIPQPVQMLCKTTAQRRSATRTVFSATEYDTPAAVLRSILLRAGDVEENPGPEWFCVACGIKLPNRYTKATTSVQCTEDRSHWIHLRCTDFKNTNDYSKTATETGYQCPICTQRQQQINNRSLIRQKLQQRQQQPHQQQQNQQQKQQQQTQGNLLNLLQININGLSGKIAELEQYLHNNKISIACLQETKLQQTSQSPQFSGYSTIRKDREGRQGGGLMILVRDDIPFQIDPLIEVNNNNAEQQQISINTDNNKLYITNLYVPPASSTTDPRNFTMQNILKDDDENRIIMGDINAHDPLWYSKLSDSRGASIAEEINNTKYIVLNEDTCTRLPRNGQPTSPDITIISQSLALTTTWSTTVSLNSDHLPITTSIEINNNNKTTTENRKFINFAKANWTGFKEECDRLISTKPLPKTVEEGEHTLRDIITTAAKHNIPVGIPKDATPCLTQEAKKIIKERDNIRKTNPTSDLLPTLNQQITDITNAEKRKRWNNAIQKISTQPNVTTKVFNTIKKLTSNNRPPLNMAISFNNKLQDTKTKIANAFNKMFTTIEPHKTCRSTRRTIRTSKQLSNVFAPQFYPSDVEAVIKSSKNSTALGPDGISPLHLKNLGTKALAYLCETLNLSLRTTTIPNKWREGNILPLPKPGKPPADGTSYRPITLLSPIAKVLERLLLPTIQQHLKPHEHQHGFRKHHSTTTALTTITDDIAQGFNQLKPERTLLLAVDLSKAFDMVNLQKLISKIQQSTLPPSIVKWLSAYLRGRRSRTIFNGKKSRSRAIHRGVPQGGVLSPLLFNYYLSDLPVPPPGIKMVSYADDLTIWTTGPIISNLTKKLNAFTPVLHNYFNEMELIISPAKSSTTLFTPTANEYNKKPKITFNNTPVPVNKNPCILGVTFDPKLNFGAHVNNTITATNSRLKALKVVESQNWIDTASLRTTYTAIVRSKLEYACPAWAHNTADNNIQKIQQVQNAGLRIVTGCYKSTPIDHLHAESRILKTKNHIKSRATQFLAAAKYQNDHPCHTLAQQQQRPRNMKETLYSKYSPSLQESINKINNKNNNTTTITYKEVLSQIHQDGKDSAIAELGPNSVLGRPAPKLSRKADNLPRAMQKMGSQLRCGHSNLLQHYRNRLDNTISDRCPKCNAAAHTTAHLFECPVDKIDAKVEDLWQHPELIIEIAEKMNGTSSNDATRH